MLTVNPTDYAQPNQATRADFTQGPSFFAIDTGVAAVARRSALLATRHPPATDSKQPGVLD
jgi:hypothetical protein